MKIQEAKEILTSLNRLSLCSYDTPIQHLKHLEELTGINGLYIKRDDLNGVGPGGNKVRALEYLLGSAVENHSDIVIASGQMNSNLCTIAAAACCKIGIHCILVHNNDEPKYPTGNTILNNLLGIERVYLGEKPESYRNEYIMQMAIELKKKGHTPYIIENGATTPLGAIGYANIPLELFEHNSQYHISDIFVAGGNGGLAAGVALGNMLLSNPYNVHVITVENTVDELNLILEDLMKNMKTLLNIPQNPLMKCQYSLHGDYRGQGWGISTPESINMIHELAAAEGIFLEKIYTSKTFFGMIDLLKKGSIVSKGACFIHSGGFGALFGQYSS